MVTAAEALPGREERMVVPARHEVLGTPLEPPFPDGLEQAVVGLGCFWGAERLFWQLPASTRRRSATPAASRRTRPTRRRAPACTGHTEAVLVVFDPAQVAYEEILRTFWEGHDPTQGNRQGNDVGTQYRSALYWTTPEQREAALASRDAYQARLAEAGYGEITTELGTAPAFFYAEPYHQQYLAKNPNGYCGLGGTGVSCPVGVGA